MLNKRKKGRKTKKILRNFDCKFVQKRANEVKNDKIIRCYFCTTMVPVAPKNLERWQDATILRVSGIAQCQTFVEPIRSTPEVSSFDLWRITTDTIKLFQREVIFLLWILYESKASSVVKLVLGLMRSLWGETPHIFSSSSLTLPDFFSFFLTKSKDLSMEQVRSLPADSS